MPSKELNTLGETQGDTQAKLSPTSQAVNDGLVTFANTNSSSPTPHTLLMESILNLMGVLVYANRLKESPYKDMFSESHWKDIAHSFSNAFCTLLGLASESPLATTVMAGSLSLPVIIKMSQLLRKQKGRMVAAG